ncbi:glycosyltransferase [Agrococcus jejuensis]|uniref:glycosyltransferase n=1 Tax=Agrococcus jejuensis TaxID=399736 RepID=UPI0021B6362D|nr:glycosyltransferase [Agrococcus jejuensis]
MIAWYVHHHGRGHLMRLLAVRPLVRVDDVVVLSSLAEPEALPAGTRWVRLPTDDAVEASGDPATNDPTAGGRLHWAPLGHAGHAQRMAAIAAVLPEADAVVVDVSVEVTALARLLGRRVALVTQPGERTDAPHAMGRALADAVIAPWPALDDAAGPHHVGGISRFEGRRGAGVREPATVLALGGGSDDPEWQAMVERAAASTPGWRWSIAGVGHWLADPWHALTTADVVVSAAGQNAIADLAAAQARAVVVPRPRPFDEQHATAARLEAEGLAVVADASATTWPALLARASASRPDWSRWRVDGAAARAAAAIERTAGLGA